MIGLIVNPIAGMGGSVGLKGTDGAETLARARALGAIPRAAQRARRSLAILARGLPGTTVLAATGEMGTDALEDLDLDVQAIPVAGPSSAAATRQAAATLQDRGVGLLVFAGGDGTARDLLGVVGLEIPLLGIPCGVKMHSGLFGISPEATGQLLLKALAAPAAEVGYRKVEVMDFDEEALRRGEMAARLYGYARAPYAKRLLQLAKGASSGADGGALRAACREIAAEMEPGVLYLIGPGTTAKLVMEALNLEGTLLGVDALRDGKLVGRDISESAARRLAEGGPLRIIVGVTGGQGFVFGRGNQPIGAALIRQAGPEGLIIVAGAEKLAALEEPRLLVDTGDPALDAALGGHHRVRVGPGHVMIMRLES